MTVKDIINICPCTIQITGIKDGHRYYFGKSYDLDVSVPFPEVDKNTWWLNATVEQMACAQREEVTSFRITYYPVLNMFINDKNYIGG